MRTLGVPLTVSRTHLSIQPDAVDCDVDALLRIRRSDSMEHLADDIDGAFLPGYAPTFSEPLRDWVERHRDLVAAGARRVLVKAIARYKSRGEWSEVERLAHRCLTIDPLNEEATLALAEAAALHGGKVEAIGILDRYLHEMGPTARELRLPAMALRRRIAEPELEFPLAPPLHVPFVGRSAEMAALAGALRSARGGAGSVHFIHGEAGIGKTRLLNEFSRAASLEGARVAAALCQSSDARRPLSAFVDLVPRLMTMPGALGCSPQSHKYLRRLSEHQASDSPPTPDTAEAALLYANVRRSLFDLLDALASETLLIITIDDTHWLDGASWEIVAEAARWMETRRLMFVLTSRDPEPHFPSTVGSWPKSVRSLALGPIDQNARERLFDATVRDTSRAAVEAFRRWCVEMSGGNPYYLSELVLRGIDAQGGFEAPPSLTTLVAQRVARLQPLSRRVLQACAVLGKNATLRRVQSVLDQPCIKLLDNFDELESAGLVQVEGARIITQHHLLAQAATSRASVLSQQLLHHKAALLLQEDFLRFGIPSLAWDSAEHWRLSGEADKGVELALACARYSLQFGRPTEAVGIIRCVLPWSLHSEMRLRVWSEYAHALRAAEQWTDLADTLEELLPNLDRTAMPELASGFRLELLEAQWNAGRISSTVVDDLIEECHVGAASADHKLRAATAAITISDNLCCAGTASRVEQFARTLAAQNVSEFAGRDYDLVFQCSYGDLDRAMEVAGSLVASIRETESEPLLCRYLLRAAHVFEVGDRLDDSLGFAREAFSIAERFSLCNSACHAARRLGWAYLDRLSTSDVALWTDKGEAWANRT
ncbi:MAG TPA: ATP-binding protein, partial [Burkholderiales bacterium]|nr:ATP-binding protein [Burkholderiales bacterium]